jgi:hypothetical protein
MRWTWSLFRHDALGLEGLAIESSVQCAGPPAGFHGNWLPNAD